MLARSVRNSNANRGDLRATMTENVRYSLIWHHQANEDVLLAISLSPLVQDSAGSTQCVVLKFICYMGEAEFGKARFGSFDDEARD